MMMLLMVLIGRRLSLGGLKGWQGQGDEEDGSFGKTHPDTNILWLSKHGAETPIKYAVCIAVADAVQITFFYILYQIPLSWTENRWHIRRLSRIPLFSKLAPQPLQDLYVVGLDQPGQLSSSHVWVAEEAVECRVRLDDVEVQVEQGHGRHERGYWSGMLDWALEWERTW